MAISTRTVHSNLEILMFSGNDEHFSSKEVFRWTLKATEAENYSAQSEELKKSSSKYDANWFQVQIKRR